MNSITKADNTSLSTGGANAFEAYGNAVSSRTIVGQLLKFSKGEYLLGEKGEEVEEGTRLVANMDELMVGWIRWEDGKPTEHVMGRVAEGYEAPRRNTLGDDDEERWETDDQGRARDPWQFSNYLILKETDGDELFTFTTSSRGGLNAIGALCKAYGKAMRQHPDEYPVIELGVDSYKHSNKSYGKIFVPELKIVGWVSKADFLEALAASGSASESEEDEEETAPPPKKAGKSTAEARF